MRKINKKRFNALFLTILAVVMMWDVIPAWLSPTDQDLPRLVINEIMVSNGTGLSDEDGDYADWIEMHNPTGQPVNLAGYALTDDPNMLQKWTFPDLSLDSGAYIIIFASGKNRSRPQAGQLHTNFKLNKDGEFLALYNLLDNEFVDVITPHYPRQIRDVSYGRPGNQAGFGYLSNPTPGTANDVVGLNDIVSKVEFSHSRGFYDAPFTVALHTSTTDATIRYTTDGSEPSDSNGQIYQAPILLNKTTLLRTIAQKEGYIPSEIDTHSYIFLEDVIRQPADPPGWPAAWGLYQTYYPGLPLKGSPVVADYAMDSRIVEASQYRKTIKDDLKSIPSISLVTTVENFEIYANAVERGVSWERPVSVEIIDPNDPGRNLQINAGIRMQGVSARWEFMPKKSFRLFFKGQYGTTRLKYPLFPDSAVDEFNTLVLRGGANRSYAGYIDAVDYTQATYTRDEWMRASQIAMSGVGSHGIFVHLYLNGLYWGLYNVVERPDAAFAAAYLGGDKMDWFAVKHGATILNPEAVEQGEEPEIMYREEISGSNERFVALLELAGRDLSIADNYEALLGLLDIEHFSDYVILNLYAGNNDWNDNNWYGVIRNHPPGPLRFFVWDAEQTWNEGARLYLGSTSDHHYIRPLFLALMENSDFRLAFADRVFKQLFHDGPLSAARAQARWLKINNDIERAIVGESARWGDVRYTDNPIDREDWLTARDNVLAQMEGNEAKLIKLLREAGYYPLIDPPAFSQPGGDMSPGLALSLSPPADDEDNLIYYTTDGSDPREARSGNVAASAKLYKDAIVLTTTTQIKTRAFDPAAQSWSAQNEAVFTMQAGVTRLHISEMMYNPLGGSDYEFLELRNSGNVPVELAGLSFDGIRFTFPPASKALAPDQVTLLVRNPAAFAERYPTVTVNGVYDGQLSNKGETITLKTASGHTLLSIAYDDENGWPISADGGGDSLIMINPAGEANDAKNWRASGEVNGTPGVAEDGSRWPE